MRLLLLTVLHLHHALSSRTIGYVAEEGSPTTAVTCDVASQTVAYASSARVIFCNEDPETLLIPLSCRDSWLFYVTTWVREATDTMSLDCNTACTDIAIVEEWPDIGITWNMYDCIDNFGAASSASVSTIYGSVYGSVAASAFPTAVTRTVTVETTTSVTTASSTTEPSNTSSVGGGDNEDQNIQGDDPEQNNRPSTGLIVGAVVGSVLGLGLLIAAVVVVSKRTRRAGFGSEEGAPETRRRHWLAPMELLRPNHQTPSSGEPESKHGHSLGPPSYPGRQPTVAASQEIFEIGDGMQTSPSAAQVTRFELQGGTTDAGGGVGRTQQQALSEQ